MTFITQACVVYLEMGKVKKALRSTWLGKLYLYLPLRNKILRLCTVDYFGSFCVKLIDRNIRQGGDEGVSLFIYEYIENS